MDKNYPIKLGQIGYQICPYKRQIGQEILAQSASVTLHLIRDLC